MWQTYLIFNCNVPFVFYGRAVKSNNFVVKRESVKLLAPILSCDKVLCIGMNYKDHCEEQNAPVPVEPVIFNKFPSCIVGPNDPITFPNETQVISNDTINIKMT